MKNLTLKHIKEKALQNMTAFRDKFIIDKKASYIKMVGAVRYILYSQDYKIFIRNWRLDRYFERLEWRHRRTRLFFITLIIIIIIQSIFYQKCLVTLIASVGELHQQIKELNDIINSSK